MVNMQILIIGWEVVIGRPAISMKPVKNISLQGNMTQIDLEQIIG